MYLTFYTNAAPKQLTWADILNNPYITQTAGDISKKKVTKEIPDDYAELLWTKRRVMYHPNLIPIDVTSIDTSEHYRHFQIPKKSNPNKMRQIDAPDDFLSNIQTMYKAQIENELQILSHKAAHAYVPTAVQ